MARERRDARAERERVTATEAAERADRERRNTADRARRDHRLLLWKRVRLWQHGPHFRRRREAWGTIAVLGFLALLVVYLITRSVSDLVGTGLVLVIASPVVVAFVFDRSRK